MTQTRDFAYSAPVSALLTLSAPKGSSSKHWLQYQKKFGLTEADIPELIRLATDAKLFWDGDESDYYGPLHALRALGELRAEAAIAPLISIIPWSEDSDWHMEELPEALGLLGPACLSALQDYLATPASNEQWYFTSTAIEAIRKIPLHYPETRDSCAQYLTDSLRQYAQQSAEKNAHLTAALLGLEVVEAAEVIGKAYTEGPMDERVCGTWPAVQVELGLAKKEDFAPEELLLPPVKGLEHLHPFYQPPSHPITISATASGLSIEGSARPIATPKGKPRKAGLSLGKTKPKPKKQGFGNSNLKKKKKRK